MPPQGTTPEPLASETEPIHKGEGDGEPGGGKGKLELQRQLGLIEGVAVIIGSIIGSGIFISPKGVLKEAGSVGMSLIVWVLCGLLSMIGALCYAELGTMIPESGGDYAYIKKAFGQFVAFLYLWAAIFVFLPTSSAIMGLTFANYVIQPLFPGCDMPDGALRLIAAVAICFLTFINSWDMKAITRLQQFFMYTKVASIVLVIMMGLVHISKGNTENFDNAFEGTSTDPGQIAVSFYSGIFSYAGWNFLNFMTEEIKNPLVNLPRAIFISLPLVTIVYVLANVAYLAILTPIEMIASDAIAVTVADQMLGQNWSWIMPLLVSLSAVGGLACHMMTSSRLCFVAARFGHFPQVLSLINEGCNTPMPALAFMGFLSLCYLCISDDLYQLIEYASFVESLFILITITGLLYMRIKFPDMNRPIKVPVIVPIIFMFICGFLVFLPLYARPIEVGMGLVIVASGVPTYFFFIYKKKPKHIKSYSDSFTTALTTGSQKLFNCVLVDKYD